MVGGETKSRDKEEILDQQHVRNIKFAIVFYFSVSIGIVFFNYHILTSTFKRPVFVSLFQQAVGVCILCLGSQLANRWPALDRCFPPVSFDAAMAWRLLPVSASFVATIALSNTCLKYVQVSTYQVARSMTIFFNITLSYLILNQRTSHQCLAACAVVVVGFLIGSLDTSTLTLTGIIAGFVSSFFQASNNVLVKRALPLLKHDERQLLFYSTTLAVPLLLPALLLAGEGDAFQLLPWDFRQSATWYVWGSLIVSGLLAMALNVSTYQVIKHTSPVTFNMVGKVKSCVQTVGGVVLLGEALHLRSLIGILLTFTGSWAYGAFKMQEAAASSRESGESSSAHTAKTPISPLPLPIVGSSGGGGPEANRRRHGDASVEELGALMDSQPSLLPVVQPVTVPDCAGGDIEAGGDSGASSPSTAASASFRMGEKEK
eukprot:GDKI01040065.1.p1 GENE.GDKI01040065.1~~GDKI01040065.1.p1  ORF type:complete len:431 (+),score=92.92 GDKI01040065.1:48-1340(+)